MGYKIRKMRCAASLMLLGAAPAGATMLVTTPAQAAVTEADVRLADAAFWAAYNRCDEQAMSALFTEDAEFYQFR